MHRQILSAVTATAIAMSATLSQASHLEYGTVALTGQRAVSESFDAYYTAFYSMSISDEGQVAFTGLMEGDDVQYPDERWGVWVGKVGQISNVMRGSATAPGVDGYIKYDAIARINANGELAVDAILNAEVGQGRDHVIWTGLPSALSVSAREGDHAPGTGPGTVFSDLDHSGIKANFHSIRLSNAGELSFVSLIQGPDVVGVEEGFWFGAPGGVQLVARRNMQAAGLPDDIHYTGLVSTTDRDGKVAFNASLTQSLPNTPRNGIWIGTPNDVRVIAMTGQEAGGIADAVFNHMSYSQAIEIDGNGRVLFAASISGPGIDATNDFGYWLADADGTYPVLRTGQTIPGTSGARATELAVELGATGEYTVFASLAGETVTSENDTAWLLGPPDGLRLIAREGMQAPGTPNGVQIGELFSTSHGTPTTPDGRMAFYTLLRGPGVTTANDGAYYLSDPDGSLHLVAREGDLFDLGNGDLRLVKALDLTAGQSDSTMNPQGELFFRAGFMDGSEGVFVVRSIPEPSSFALLTIALVGVVASRRRR